MGENKKKCAQESGKTEKETNVCKSPLILTFVPTETHPISRRPVILLFIDWYLPGYKAGGPIRSMANMVQRLSGEYDFRIITRDTDYTDKDPYPGIRSDEWNEGPFGEKVFFFSEKGLNRKNLRKLIRETEYDIAYINGIYSWNFSIVPLILCRRYKDRKLIVSTRGMLASSAIDVKGGKKKLFLNLARFAGIYRNVIFHVTNEAEKEDVQREIGKHANILVADNFPALRSIPEQRISSKKKDELRIINIARIAPEKNLDYALQILNSAGGGKAVFDVYGPVYDLNYFERCQNTVRHLPEGFSVDFKGPVDPEKIHGLLGDYDLMFMPTRGENFGHIILESLMAGTPVLISDRTPFTNAEGVVAVSLEDESKMLAALHRFINMDAQEHQTLVNAALAEARIKNDTSPLLERYRQLFGK